MRGIFCVDPGGTTGVAWGVFDDRAESVATAMLERQDSGSETIHHGRVEGSSQDIQDIIRNQTADIWELWERFWTDTRDLENVDFVVEHFVLTNSPHGHKAGVEGIFPAFMVGAIIEMLPVQIILQTASQGMRYHTRKFHTMYGTWITGREHEREAWAHVAARLHAVLR
jgi:hypothetical protein